MRERIGLVTVGDSDLETCGQRNDLDKQTDTTRALWLSAETRFRTVQKRKPPFLLSRVTPTPLLNAPNGNDKTPSRPPPPLTLCVPLPVLRTKYRANKISISEQSWVACTLPERAFVRLGS